MVLALVWLLGGAGVAWTQGTRKDDIVINSRGFPQGGASVAICAQPAVTTTTPCSPLASVFSNPALTQALVNPLVTDGLGNYNFYASPGKYTIQIYGAGITTKVIPDVVLPNDPSAPTFTSVTSTSGITAISLTLSGNLTVSGSVSVTLGLSAATITLANQTTPPAAPAAGSTIVYTKTDKKPYFKDDAGAETAFATGTGSGNMVYASNQAGATADLKIQAAMNSLPATGGTVIVDLQGAQTVATDVFNAVTKNVHLWFSSGQYSFSANTTFPMNMSVQFSRGAQFVVPTAVTVTILQPIDAPNSKIFSLAGTGLVKLPGLKGTPGFMDVSWWGAVEDTATDSTPAFLAAWNAARNNEGGTVWAPETANIVGSQRYLLSTALTLPDPGSNPIQMWLSGPLRLGATLTVNHANAIIGLPGNFTQVAQGARKQAILIDVLAAANPAILVAGDDVRLENLAITSAGLPTYGGVLIRTDNASALTISGVSTAHDDADLTAVGLRIRTTVGGTSFDILIEQCQFSGVTSAAGAKPVQFTTSSASLPRQVTMRQTRFNNHGILIDTATATAGPNGYSFEDILYENFADDFLKFNITGQVQISGFNFDRIGMADSAALAGIVKVVSGGTNTQTGGFYFRNNGAPWLLDADMVVQNVVVTEAQGTITPHAVPPTSPGPQFIKPGSTMPRYVRFAGANATAFPDAHLEANIPVHVANANDMHVDMATPTGLAATLAAGGTLTVGQAFFWVVAARDDLTKETLASNEVTLTATTGNQTANLTWTAVPGAVSYKIYRGTAAGVENVFFTSATTSFSDTGAAGATGSPAPYTAASISRADSAGLLGQKLALAATTNASLGTPANGTIVYCSDCTIANPCAGGGTGALAKRLNGVWVCN